MKKSTLAWLLTALLAAVALVAFAALTPNGYEVRRCVDWVKSDLSLPKTTQHLSCVQNKPETGYTFKMKTPNAAEIKGMKSKCPDIARIVRDGGTWSNGKISSKASNQLYAFVYDKTKGELTVTMDWNN